MIFYQNAPGSAPRKPLKEPRRLLHAILSAALHRVVVGPQYLVHIARTQPALSRQIDRPSSPSLRFARRSSTSMISSAPLLAPCARSICSVQMLSPVRKKIQIAQDPTAARPNESIVDSTVKSHNLSPPCPLADDQKPPYLADDQKPHYREDVGCLPRYIDSL